VQPTAGLQRLEEVAEQRIVVEHPVKRRGTEDAIEAAKKWQAEKIGSHELHLIAKVRAKILLRVEHHVAGNIKSNDAAARHILQEQASQLARAATGVEYPLISPKVKVIEYPLSPQELRRRETVVLFGIPLARCARGLRHRELDRRQRLVEVVQNIDHILDANRDAHHPVGDADLAAPFLADCGVRHGSGM